jgi:serine protease inhibitor
VKRGHAGAAGLLAAGLLAVAGCGGAAQGTALRGEGEVRVVPIASAQALPSVVDATRRIGVTTLATASRDGNIVVSPSSLAMALAMLTEGARGDTLDALETMLGAAGEQRRDAIAALRGALLAYDGDPAVAAGKELPDRPIIHLANQVVVDDEYEPSLAYLDALVDVFDAGLQTTDLSSQAGMDVLSAWIRQHTGGLIKETAMQPSPDLRLVLQDAVLLAARWQTPFASNGTAPRPFTLPDGSQVEAEAMAAMEQWRFAEVDGWQAIRLPYVEALHADILLPPEGVDPAEVSADLLARASAALDAAAPGLVMLSLPTLDVGPDKVDLMEILPAVGAPVLCRDAPDLSGIGPGDLCVLQAAQQAVLRVDEEGTVAAAVTEIGVGETAAPMPEHELHFDRPYLFTIAHTETGWPLFLAAIRDPRH